MNIDSDKGIQEALQDFLEEREGKKRPVVVFCLFFCSHFLTIIVYFSAVILVSIIPTLLKVYA